jgi:hypothetical protein
MVRRVWYTLAQPDALYLFDAVLADERVSIDQWLRESLAQISETTSGTHWMVQFVNQLTLAALQQDPSYLVLALRQGRDETPDVQAVVALLARYGVALPNNTELVRQIEDARSLAESALDIAERIINVRRPALIEVHLHPDYMREIFGEILSGPNSALAKRENQPDILQQCDELSAAIFQRFGLRLPDLEWVPSEAIAAAHVAVRANHVLGTPWRGLRAHQLLADAPPSLLEGMGIAAYGASHPMTGKPVAIVDSSDSEKLGTAVTHWTASEVLVLQLHAELIRLRARLLCVEDVVYELALLEAVMAELVSTFLDRVSPSTLTAVLRTLLDDGISIHDLCSIMESMVGATAATSVADYAAVVRRDLGNYLAYHYRGDGLARVQSIDVEVEALPTFSALGEVDRELWRERVFAESRAHRDCVVRTHPAARVYVRELLRPELPDLPVVSTDEILDESVDVVARLEFVRAGGTLDRRA